ncbi:MAG TPA: AmmeMemoRadiSam system protein B [Kiritimatiellia bacterium]|nr:AmmeMemoRadiSam system protein B [Kiritimatiellia bacterium]HRZ11110.1 AmmeMemoRadiSam system protein B [Kiritimatiellia bacterium]HSA19518.1 AmmeMemoRadiSam system protein B [Kiritimatiellia bacterium]
MHLVRRGGLLPWVVLALGLTSCTRAETPPAAEKKVLATHLAGSWFTADPDELARELQGYMDRAEGPVLENVVALIQPHAGYRFSGPAAGFGARQIAGRPFTRVVVLGPSHRVPMRNLVALPDATHFSTPLGEVPLDLDFMRTLGSSPYFRVIPEAHAGEHSVQIQVPFLQQALGDFRLVPLVVGQLDEAAIRGAAEVLRGLLDEATLVVASSDFTHYGPNYGYLPFRDDVEKNLEKLDMGAVDLIRNKGVAGFQAYCGRTGATICGRDPISILLALLPADAEARLLRYDASGRVTGDFENSVSYVSLAFTGRWKKEEAMPKPASEFTLTADDQQALLKLARGTIEYYLEHGRPPKPEDLGIAVSSTMQQVAGAFVTLHKRGDLRGCIGEIVPRRPVCQAIVEQAVNAAVNDYRFNPVTADELPGLHVEISVLTPPVDVKSWRDIVIGRHGMILSKQGRSAVFLPQVAPEQGWGIEETLTHLSMKAGLPPDAWREGASYKVFEAVVFGEEKK